MKWYALIITFFIVSCSENKLPKVEVFSDSEAKKRDGHQFEELKLFAIDSLQVNELSPKEFLDALIKKYKEVCKSLDEEALTFTLGRIEDHGYRFSDFYEDITFYQCLAEYALRANLNLMFDDGKIELIKPVNDGEQYIRIFQVHPTLGVKYQKLGLVSYDSDENSTNKALKSAQSYFNTSTLTEFKFIPATSALFVAGTSSDLNNFDAALQFYEYKHDLGYTAYLFKVPSKVEVKSDLKFLNLKRLVMSNKGRGKLLTFKKMMWIPEYPPKPVGDIMNVKDQRHDSHGKQSVLCANSGSFTNRFGFQDDWCVSAEVERKGIGYRLYGSAYYGLGTKPYKFDVIVHPYEHKLIKLEIDENEARFLFVAPSLKARTYDVQQELKETKPEDYISADSLPVISE